MGKNNSKLLKLEEVKKKRSTPGNTPKKTPTHPPLCHEIKGETPL